MGYRKIYDSLIHSTVWREEMHVRVVWITMLVMGDADGAVMASVPGLSDAARVSLEQCLDALERLSAPDEWSRTKDHEGRRIEEIDGGWLILNARKYRDRVEADDRRARTAERVRRHRAKARQSSDVTPSNTTVTQSNAPYTNTNTDTEAKADTWGEDSRAKAFAEFWAGYPRKSHKATALKAWQRLKPSAALCARILQAVTEQRQSHQWQRDGGQFIPYPATWLNGACWDDEPVTGVLPPMSKGEQRTQRHVELIERSRLADEAEAREKAAEVFDA